MKKLLSLLLTVVMLCSLLAVFIGSASAEENVSPDYDNIVKKKEIIAFNNATEASSEHFTLKAKNYTQSGWQPPLTIEAKAENIIITNVETTYNASGAYYTGVNVNVGKKREYMPDYGSVVHIDEINYPSIKFTGGGEFSNFGDFTVYYYTYEDTPVAGEEVEKIGFNNNDIAQSFHFDLYDNGHDKDGWRVSDYNKLTVKAADNVKITRIEAVVSKNGDYYSGLKVSSGKKIETGSVPDGASVHINEINDYSVVFSCDREVTMKDFVVYYTACEHIWPEGEGLTKRLRSLSAGKIGAGMVDSSSMQALVDKIGKENAEKLVKIYNGEDVDGTELYSILNDKNFDVTDHVDISSEWSGTLLLEDYKTYTFTKSMTVTAPSTTSAMEVENRGKAFLNIPKGVTVTIKGGNGENAEGGRPGILVSEYSTLVIKGEGNLIVEGGNGGNAGNGVGGGGAAAAIGGIGGNGGGGRGFACGKIFILETVNVSAHAGKAGNNDASGAQGGMQPLYGIGGGGGGGNSNGGIATGYSGTSGTVYINREATVEGRPCFYYDADLSLAADMVVSNGEAPLMLGDITKVNNYTGHAYEPLALALLEAVSHDAVYGGYETFVPQTGVQKEKNGAFRYTDSGDWYKEMVDTCGGYAFLVLDTFQECAREYFKDVSEDDADEANPYDFVEAVYGAVDTIRMMSGKDIYGTEVGVAAKTLLHDLFFCDHYCEPDGGNRNAPGYTKTNRTEGTHSTKDGALRVIHITHIKMSEANTNRTLTLKYDTTRDHTAFDYHYYYHFKGALLVEHDKKDGINGSNWMKYLPQEMPITEVNMPGSHDAGLYSTDNLISSMVRAQTLSITDQLKAGARYFDIRVNAENGELRIYHGPALGRDTRDDTPLTFDKVIDMMDEFLAENPEQFIIVMYNAEKNHMTDEAESTLYNQLRDKYNIRDYNQNGVCAEQAGDTVDQTKTRHYQINLNGNNIIVPTVGFSKNSIYFVFAHNVDKWEDHYDVNASVKKEYVEMAFSASPNQVTNNDQPLYWSANSDEENSIGALFRGTVTPENIVLDNPKIVFASTYLTMETSFLIPDPIGAGDRVNEWIDMYSFREGKRYGYVLLNNVNSYTCSRIYLSNIFQRDEVYGGDYDGDGEPDLKTTIVGSVFSGGTLWLIIGVAGVAVLAAVVIVVVKKKKKPVTANTATDENTEE